MVISLLQKYALTAPGTAKIIPTTTRYPIFAPKIPAAANAPGCGGIRQCTEYKDVARTVAIKGIAILDLLLNDFASPLKIINPESQKIGKPVIKPVIPSAAALLFSPVLESIYLAILNVPPVLSRITPIIAPNIIRKPIDPIVLPKPSFIVRITSEIGIVANARRRDTVNRAIKAFSFKLVVSTIIRMMAKTTRKVINIALIMY